MGRHHGWVLIWKPTLIHVSNMCTCGCIRVRPDGPGSCVRAEWSRPPLLFWAIFDAIYGGLHTTKSNNSPSDPSARPEEESDVPPRPPGGKSCSSPKSAFLNTACFANPMYYVWLMVIIDENNVDSDVNTRMSGGIITIYKHRSKTNETNTHPYKERERERERERVYVCTNLAELH